MKSLYQEEQGRSRGRVYTSICEHNKIVISQGKETNECTICSKHKEKVQAPFVPNMTPFFNHGLGCVTNGTRHAEHIAKKRGLIPLGKERLK